VNRLPASSWEQTIRRQKNTLREELKLLDVRISEEEAARLLFLAQRKYDRYDLFSPGETFLGRLNDWLANFQAKDRQIAMEIVESLKFISQYEMKELAVATFENIRVCLSKGFYDLPRESWSAFLDSREQKSDSELSKSIFVACSDDILFDYLRRYARQQVDILEKDNFVEYYKADERWRADLPEYKRLFLIDQLSGSGITAIRREGAEWKGKLPRFFEIWRNDIIDCEVYYCPFIQSTVSKEHLRTNLPLWLKEIDWNISLKVMPTCDISVSPCLSSDGGFSIDECLPASKLCKKEEYFSRFVDDRHIKKGGPAYYGFGRAGLTLILQPNCPNNTIPLLWHSCNDWFPLFPRVSHHRQRN
jgi:hypothetical protein